jgi:hypothetical protein
MLKTPTNTPIPVILRAATGLLRGAALGTLAIVIAACSEEAPPSTTSTGGAAGTAGAGAGTAGASAGTAGASAGTGGVSGAAGTGGLAGAPPTCAYQQIITSQCARAGCHNTVFTASDMDLQAAGYEQRLINQPAKYTDITCPDPGGGLPVPCVPADCTSGALLINTANPAESFMLKKLLGTQLGCGKQMPIAPGTVTEAERACLVEWVHYLAGG